MTSSDCTIVIDIHDISNDVIECHAWRNKETNIGTCKIVMENVANTWGGDFEPNDEINIMVNGGLLWHGFVDDAKPYLDNKGVLTNRLEVTGRDDGRALTDLYLTKKYASSAVHPALWLAAEIIDDILFKLGDPLLFVPPGGSPAIEMYECSRTYLGDALKEIAGLVGYDFYIDNAGTLQFFSAGTVDSGVDLKCISGDVTNNLLSFDFYEEMGFSIKNCIEINAGSVKDHWTEGNASDWTATGGGVVTDEVTQVGMGESSIELACTGVSGMYLDFTAPLYGYTLLNLHEVATAKFVVKGTVVTFATFDINPYLIDVAGNKIRYYQEERGAGSKGFTETVEAGLTQPWLVVSFPLGAAVNNPIYPSGTASTGHWNYMGGAITFDWAQVAKIGFDWSRNINGVVWIDGLYIPSVEAHSIKDAPADYPIYGKRMYREYKSELKSQIELDAYATKVLAQKKDPIQKFTATTIGQLNTKYAAQAVHVRAPDFGIAALTSYTIVQVHHYLKHEINKKGWDYLTDYELTAQDTDPNRVIRDDNPMEALLRELRRLNRLRDGAEKGFNPYDVTGTFTAVNRGATFPATAVDGDLFFLTVDAVYGGLQYYGPALYKYVAATNTWIRDPMLMYRAAVPPAGGEVLGDVYFNTVTSILYQWSGAAWVMIGITNIADASDYATVIWPTDQLAIEVRPWTGNLSIVWDDRNDEPPTDWNHFKWGLKNFENVNDATIQYADGTAVDVNFGQDLNVGDGEWFVYWDEAFKTGGDYDLKWTQNYSVASGAGKGLVAVVQVRNATTESPSILLYNTYIPQMGVGSIVAHSIYSKHISGDWITGKNFRTAVGVGAGGGPAGVRFDANGIYGYSGGVTQTFRLQSVDGHIRVIGNGMFEIYKNAATLVGWLDYALYGGVDTFALRSNNVNLILDANGDIVTFTPGGDIIFDDDFGALRPTTDLGVDLGTPSLSFRYFVPTTAIGSRPGAAAGVHGLLWVETLGGAKDKAWICLKNDADGYEWVQLAVST